MKTYTNKLVIFGLLDQLGCATARGDVEAVKSLRERLILCPTGDNKPLCDANHEVFYVSGKWARGMIDGRSAKPMVRAAVERAIAALQSPGVPA